MATKPIRRSRALANRAGVYCILNLANHKRYIGSAVDVRRRIYVHKWMLRSGRHDSGLLQGAWNRDGEASFVFAAIEYCNKDAIFARETLWIKALRSAERAFGYNVCPVGGSRAGVPQPDGHAEQIRAIHLGKKKTPEHREKIRLASILRWQDKDERAKQSARRMGKQKPDHRKLSDAQVASLRNDRSLGFTYAQLKRKYGCGPQTIFNIVKGIHYLPSREHSK